MTNQEKLAMLEDLFDMDEGSLSADMSLEDVEEYDSMTRLSLIVMLEDEFGVKLDGTAVKGFKSVNDIMDKMEK